MAELKSYDVVINKMRTVVKLSDADAKKRGLTEKDLAKAPTKGRTASNKAAAPSGNKADDSGKSES